MVTMILGDKITKLRKQNGWSQEELAEKLGISRQSVSKWESGQSIPDIDKIIRMSGLFGISTDYLLKDELEEISPETSVEIKEEKNLREVTLEEANTYMDLTERLSVRIAVRSRRPPTPRRAPPSPPCLPAAASWPWPPASCLGCAPSVGK